MKSDIEKSLKSRIKNIAIEKNITPDFLWQNLVLERFLVRVSKSRYSDYFVLKGGTLLSKLIEIGRETKDLDFAVNGISNNLKEIEKVIREIISIPVSDGFQFENVKIKEMPHPLMNYFGARIIMTVFFGKIRFKVLIDLGFGDLFKADLYDFPLIGNRKGSLFESSIQLKCYPIDFIFAEKLHCIIVRGQDNSRMKDFHDLFLLIKQKGDEFNDNFMLILRKVFEHRNSTLVIPLNFTENDLIELQNHWKRHLTSLKFRHSLPSQIKDVILVISNWLEKKDILNLSK